MYSPPRPCVGARRARVGGRRGGVGVWVCVGVCVCGWACVCVGLRVCGLKAGGQGFQPQQGITAPPHPPTPPNTPACEREATRTPSSNPSKGNGGHESVLQAERLTTTHLTTIVNLGEIQALSL